METFFEENYIITDTMIIFKPDYQRKNTIRISMRNITIEFPDVKIGNVLSNYANLIGKTYYLLYRKKNSIFL